MVLRFCNAASITSQLAVGSEIAFAQSTVAPLTASINTALDFYMNFTIQKQVGAGTYSVMNYNVKICKP